ncbi:hypothetical protein L228DRAFT_239456 [Xylona heveae TC161]|uniref:AMP-activated protein kinase glycogen-binding domain-containing protein n=1 Tax=Xylona heveae (strain CBS 132557 / TC161) TaxID=1328760 RepID=A0A165FWX1_XYLHT|nr:hypothetical protein L228DRAFT_239456 [Xylona heveae TC161]KZF21482.1 hypothetical protein L228DRAFT_239456 [Xylona heveae TC161]
MVKITFVHPGTQPPVFVAGSFTTPPWEPQEMQYTQLQSDAAQGPTEYRFHKDVDIPVGEWQYKFRIGHGDWWALDEATETATDVAGNKNNLLRVEKSDSETGQKESDKALLSANTQHVPELVVEKVSNEPAYGDDLGPDATFTQRLAHERRAMDAEPDKVIISPKAEANQKASWLEDTSSRNVSATPIPQVAATAAEVADVAAMLDKTPEPGSSRLSSTKPERLSSTPIAEVAATAAEVADIAALLDKTPVTSRPASAIPGRLSSTPIPEVAATAAEVADVAATLDRTPSSATPRPAGARPERLSSTPIAQVAATAAEVADVAARLDRTPEPGASKQTSKTLIEQAAARAAALANAPVKPEKSGQGPPELSRMDRQRLSLAPVPDSVELVNAAAETTRAKEKDEKESAAANPTNGFPTNMESSGPEDSGTNSPRVEHAPLFAHECLSPLDSKDSKQYIESKLGVGLNEETIEDEDFDDPMLENFPTERAGILRRIRTLSTNLNEDHTLPEGFPISPVHVSDHHRDDHLTPVTPQKEDHLSLLTPLTPQREDSLLPHKDEQASRVPASSASNERSSPLLSIPEEQDAPPLALPEAANTVKGNHSDCDGLAGEATNETISNRKQDPDSHKADGPVSEQPPPSRAQRAETDGTDENSGPDAPSASSEPTLRQRKATSGSESSSSPNGAGPVYVPPNNKHLNIFQAVWRTVFVGWFGGFITRLCRGNRRA